MAAQITGRATWQAIPNQNRSSPQPPEPQPPTSGDNALGCWRATPGMYHVAIKTLDDGPINPSNT